MITRTYNIAEIAKLLGVSTATVASWIRAGELAAVNVSRSRGSKKPRWRITPDALAAFEAARAATPAAPTPTRKRKSESTNVVRFYE